jgi:hypothetical protein
MVYPSSRMWSAAERSGSRRRRKGRRVGWWRWGKGGVAIAAAAKAESSPTGVRKVLRMGLGSLT